MYSETICRSNEDFKDFLNNVRGTESMRQFCYYMGVDYDLGYSILKGRRNTSLAVFFSILDEMGYDVIISRRLQNDKGRKESTAENEQEDPEMEKGRG